MSSDIVLKKINNKLVVPLKTRFEIDTRPILGSELFPELYANIFLVARKKSGKTITIQTILKSCCGKETTVISFCSTITKDKNWMAIKDWCKDNEIKFHCFPSIKEGKVDVLDKLLNKLQDEGEEEQLSSEMEAKTKGLFSESEDEDDDKAEYEDYSEDEIDDIPMFGKKEKQHTEEGTKLFDKKNSSSLKKKQPYQAPEIILIFDDLSHELKLPSLVSLLKKNRHYKLKTIISSQYLNDCKPEQIKQEDYVLVYKGCSDDKLEKLRNDCDLGISFDTLKKIYEHATEDKFNFLYIDVRNDSYRKNFNMQYVINID